MEDIQDLGVFNYIKLSIDITKIYIHINIQIYLHINHILYFWYDIQLSNVFKTILGDFPDGPMVKNPPAN